MKLKGINTSSKRTINLIKKTFAELVEEKREIKNITVTELVKRAGITRGAFYSHYDNIYELANEFQEEIIENIFDKELPISENDINKYFDDIFSYLEKNENIYSKLLTSDDTMIFVKRINHKMTTAISRNLPPNHNLDVIFFIEGTINLIIKYFKGEINESLQDINKYIQKVASTFFLS